MPKIKMSEVVQMLDEVGKKDKSNTAIYVELLTDVDNIDRPIDDVLGLKLYTGYVDRPPVFIERDPVMDRTMEWLLRKMYSMYHGQGSNNMVYSYSVVYK